MYRGADREIHTEASKHKGLPAPEASKVLGLRTADTVGSHHGAQPAEI